MTNYKSRSFVVVGASLARAQPIGVLPFLLSSRLLHRPRIVLGQHSAEAQP